jgi:transposase
VDRPRGGRPHALSAADWAVLEEALERGPQAYDLPMTVWSIRDLQALLERERGVMVSVDTVHRAVRALGFRSRRPRHDLTHRQDQAAVAAAKQVLDWLQKKTTAAPNRPAAERLHLVYVDECEVHTHPYLAKVWQRKGQPLKVPAAGEDQKAVVFGAVDYATGQVVWQTSPRKGEVAFSAFLDHLAAALPAREPVVVVLDNVGYHKSHALREVWRRSANRLEPFFLPAYCLPMPHSSI